MGYIHHGEGSRGPTRNENLFGLARTRRGPCSDAVRIDKMTGMAITQIHAGEMTVAVQMLDDAQAVVEVIGDEKRIGIGAERNSQRVDGLFVVVVASGGRDGGELRDGNKWSGDFRCRAIRRGRNRFGCIRQEGEDPDFIFETAGNVKRVGPRRIGIRRECGANLNALRPGEINILNYHGSRPSVQIENAQGLLFGIRGRAELDAIAAIDADEVAAAAVFCAVVGAANKSNRKRADGGMPRASVHDDRAGGSDGPPFGSGLARYGLRLGKCQRSRACHDSEKDQQRPQSNTLTNAWLQMAPPEDETSRHEFIT